MRHVETNLVGRRGRLLPPGPGTTRLRSFVLLAGGYRVDGFSSRVSRSVLDLPLSSSLQLLDVWCARIREFLDVAAPVFTDPNVRILMGPSGPAPVVERRVADLPITLERDMSGYRGTAGALRDLCEQFGDDDHVLVGNASQCQGAGTLQQFVAEADPSSGISLGVGGDGSPAGLMLIQCRALRDVPTVGFIDLKEQALPRIAAESRVRVIETSAGVSPPIREVRSYLDAVRSWHCSGSLCGVRSQNPFEERWKPAFSIVEDEADVGAGARLHDSVVLSGGVVEPGCVVVRSVVGPGGVVRRRDRAIDRLVLGEEKTKRDAGRHLGERRT